jgi:hypothetical protein
MSWLIATLFTSPLLVQHAWRRKPAALSPPRPAGQRDRHPRFGAQCAGGQGSLNSIVEVIASEDIGKLPDTTIAESLARLPGLSSGLDRGNASRSWRAAWARASSAHPERPRTGIVGT